MNSAFIYHWWAEKPEDGHGNEDGPPYTNLRTPIVPSIATLRAQNKDIPIYVLDGTNFDVDWGEFPEVLNFKVVKFEQTLKEYSHRPGWRHLSRIFDLQTFHKEIPEDIIVYSDSDVFWFDDPLPLMSDPVKFCFNGYNSGFFYYDKKSNLVKQFFEEFNDCTMKALNDEVFREEVWSCRDQRHWYFVLDEAILEYLAFYPWEQGHLKREEVDFLDVGMDLREHVTARELQRVNIHEMKMFHTNGLMVQNKFPKNSGEEEHARGLVCLLFKELYQSLKEVLTEDQISKIYKKEEMDHFFPMQIKFKDSRLVNKILLTKTDDGNFSLMDALSLEQRFF